MAEKTEQLEAELRASYEKQVRLEVRIADLESQLTARNSDILNLKETIRELMANPTST